MRTGKKRRQSGQGLSVGCGPMGRYPCKGICLMSNSIYNYHCEPCWCLSFLISSYPGSPLALTLLPAYVYAPRPSSSVALYLPLLPFLPLPVPPFPRPASSHPSLPRCGVTSGNSYEGSCRHDDLNNDLGAEGATALASGLSALKNLKSINVW